MSLPVRKTGRRRCMSNGFGHKGRRAVFSRIAVLNSRSPEQSGDRLLLQKGEMSMALSLQAAQPQKFLTTKLNKVRRSFIQVRKNFVLLWRLCGSRFFIACGAGLLLFSASPAHADCASPAGAESATRYDFTAHKLYYCDGTDWVEIGAAEGGGVSQSTYVECTGTGCYATCPSGWIRSGCGPMSAGTTRCSPVSGQRCQTSGGGSCAAICVR